MMRNARNRDGFFFSSLMLRAWRNRDEKKNPSLFLPCLGVVLPFPPEKQKAPPWEPFVPFEKSLLVVGDFGDGAHGALFQAFAASDAAVFADYFHNTAGNVKHILRAGIDADSAADAFVFIDNRTRHGISFSTLSRARAEPKTPMPRALPPTYAICARYHESARLQAITCKFLAVAMFFEKTAASTTYLEGDLVPNALRATSGKYIRFRVVRKDLGDSCLA